jgi:DNA-directed RNA polymerase II subunit RPB1
MNAPSLTRTLPISLPVAATLRKVFAAIALLLGTLLASADATAQMVVYESFRPVAPVAVAPYVANYTPAGNYAAVTAFSPPVAPYAAAPVAVTSSFAPAVAAAVPMTASYAPVNAGYAPTTAYYAPTTAYYAPTTAYYAPTTAYYAPAVAAPMTTYYAPAAVAVPVYRRGLFGAYRPVRAAWYMPGYSY